MMMLSQASEVMSGQFIGTDVSFSSVDFDTRRLKDRALFVAIHGVHQNGHAYINQAMEHGAAAVVVDEASNKLAQAPHIQVKNTTLALGDLARYWRAQFNIPVVGVTGSNGKTTITQVLGKIFKHHCPGVVPHGSFNNHWGVPLTLLRLRDKHQSAVIEMGMNHAGELQVLGDIVKPTIGIISNASAAHLAGLKSVGKVAKAKGELIDAVSKHGCIVLNRDDAFYADWKMRAGTRKVTTFGEHHMADVRLITLHNGEIRLSILGKDATFSFALLGKFNALNAAAAVAAAINVDVPVRAISLGLKSLDAVNGRLQRCFTSDLLSVIDDSYNANPASMHAAIDVLSDEKGRKILVLGAMGELGEKSQNLHQDVAKYAQEKGVDALYLLADQKIPGYLRDMAAYEKGFGSQAKVFSDVSSLVSDILACPAQSLPSTVLVKGSRLSRMERVAEALKQGGDAC